MSSRLVEDVNDFDTSLVFQYSDSFCNFILLIDHEEVAGAVMVFSKVDSNSKGDCTSNKHAII